MNREVKKAVNTVTEKFHKEILELSPSEFTKFYIKEVKLILEDWGDKIEEYVSSLTVRDINLLKENQ